MKHKITPCVLTSSRICMRPHKNGDEFLLNQAILDSFDKLHEWMEWAIKPPSIEETKAYVEFSQKCWSIEDPEELPKRNMVHAKRVRAGNQVPSHAELGS